MDRRLWRQMVRYVSGEATAEERAELERRLEADLQQSREVDSLRRLSGAVGRAPAYDVDTAAVWQRVAERTVLAEPAAAKAAGSGRQTGAAAAASSRWLRSPALLRVAAVLALVFAAGALWQPGREFVRDHVVHSTVTTGKGERLQLELPDGTRVLLGVDSRLRHPRRFRGDTRDVHLEGAAYFEVAHDATRAFRVYTAGSVTRVLGTKFTVRDYAMADEPARVAVTEGRVAVRARHGQDDTEAILTGGEAAELMAGGAIAQVVGIHESTELAWTRGAIALHNASVPAVLAEIGRWYDVEIRVEDAALAARHLTISFDDEPLDTILQEVAAVLDARITRRGSTLVLEPATSSGNLDASSTRNGSR